MKALEINTVKNVAINDLVCSPNVVVMLKQRISTNDRGDVSSTIRYIELCPVTKTEPLALLQGVLRLYLAEFRVSKDFERTYKETNIKQCKIFRQFLNTNVLYRSDSQGKLADALISDVPFSQTAINVKDYHTLATCTKDNMKAAIYQHAKAILAQCQYKTLIIKEVKAIEKIEQATADTAPEKSTRKPSTVTKPTTGATTYVSTPPAMVAAPAAM